MNTAIRSSFCVLVALALAACTKGAGPAETPAPTATVNFPLYSNAQVTSTAPYDTTAIVQALRSLATSSPSSSDNNGLTPVKGNEELARTAATMVDLHKWLGQLHDSPPSDLTATTDLSSAGADPSQLQQFSIDAQAFESKDKKRFVVVMVMDPKKTYQQTSALLDMIDKYQSIPAFIRAPLEDQIKKQTGVSVSQLLDKSNPIGLVLFAVKTMHTTNDRAIIIMDGTKT